MNIEFIKNPETGILEAWEDGKVVGEFVTTGMLAKGWRLTDCIVRKEQRMCSYRGSRPIDRYMYSREKRRQGILN